MQDTFYQNDDCNQNDCQQDNRPCGCGGYQGYDCKDNMSMDDCCCKQTVKYFKKVCTWKPIGYKKCCVIKPCDPPSPCC